MSEHSQLIEFKAAFQVLKNLVQKMESGDLSLEQSLQACEQGAKLTNQCQQTLVQVEQRVTVLTAEGNELDFCVNKGAT